MFLNFLRNKSNFKFILSIDGRKGRFLRKLHNGKNGLKFCKYNGSKKLYEIVECAYNSESINFDNSSGMNFAL